MYEGGAKGDGGGVADANIEMFWGREYAVLRRSVCEMIADDFADLDAANLMEEEHRTGRLVLSRG